MTRKPLLGAVMAAMLMGFGAAAQAQYTAIVSVAPPAPRHEAAPGHRAGWVWAPGHYVWRGDEYTWVEGSWMRERQGYAYQEPRWVQRGNGQWVMVGGTWEQQREERREARREERMNPNGDIDRDGIANQYDRDRDGDGIRNHRDRYPDNPRRS